MSKIFIFGIGGTGARVLKSLAFLSAAGVDFKSDTLIPIFIDTDASNGDTIRAMRAFDLYESIRTERTGGEFFKTNIQKLSSLQSAGNTLVGNIDKSYLLKFSQSNKTFGDYIKINTLGVANEDPNKALLETLYSKSEKPSLAELNLNMNVGFKGNPNIGALVFNEFKQSDSYQFFEGVFNQGDKIIVVGSVFGGTGASGIPVLVNTFRASNLPKISNAKIATILILPYFAVNQDENSAINHNLFNTKAVAALSYYEKQMYKDKIDAVYYIADDKNPAPFANNEGGMDQKNPAHAVELFSASAIAHFDSEADQTDRSNPSFFEFGVRERKYPHDGIHSFEAGFKQSVVKPLSIFMLFSILLHKTLQAGDNYAPRKDTGITGNSLRNLGGKYTELDEFINEFSAWLNELSDKGTNTFMPFSTHDFTNADSNSYIQGKELKKGLFGGLPIPSTPPEITKSTDSFIKANKAPKGSFKVILEAYSEACTNIFNSHYSNI